MPMAAYKIVRRERSSHAFSQLTSATLSRLGGLDLEGIQLGYFC
jgi:hypothetical protein